MTAQVILCRTDMRRMLNFTLHEQGDRECEVAARAGFTLDREAAGIEVEGVDASEIQAAVRRLCAQLLEAGEAGEAVLLGGYAGLWVSAVMEMMRRGERLPELWCFATRRSRDRDGRFVFQGEGLWRVG